jgi:hypothetical protein
MDRRKLVAGIVLVGLGLGLALAATVAHLAWALPLRELPLRPGMIDGEILTVLGVVLMLFGRHRSLRDRVERTGRQASAGAWHLARG